MRKLLALSLILLAVSAPALAGDTAADPYPLTTCIVTDGPLGDNPVVVEHEGRELRFGSDGCVEAFNADQAKYLAKLDAAIIEDQLAIYPLDTCLKAGGKLDGMGEPFNYVHNNRLVRFCCGGCVEGFKANADEYMAKLDEAVIEAQLESYPLETCVNLGTKLGGMGKPRNIVVAGRLVRLCCGTCVRSVMANPTPALAKLAEVRAAAEETK